MGTYYPSHNYGPEHAASLADGTYADFASDSNSAQPKRQPSEKQIEANRRNAQKSTGPRTEDGKARCSLNAFRHGITGAVSALTEEDRAAKEAFIAPLIESMNPATPVERQFATAIADGHWRLNRIRALEDNMFSLGHFGPASDLDVDNPELHGALTHARVFLETSKAFERLTLYEQRIQRAIRNDMRELEALRQQRLAARAEALAEAMKLTELAEFEEEEPATYSANGSVFSTEEIQQQIDRKRRLKRADWCEKQDWDPKYPYPYAA